MKINQAELSHHLMDVFLDLKNMSLKHEDHKDAMEHAKTLSIIAEKISQRGAYFERVQGERKRGEERKNARPASAGVTV
jgi:hypothetical protein